MYANVLFFQAGSRWGAKIRHFSAFIHFFNIKKEYNHFMGIC